MKLKHGEKWILAGTSVAFPLVTFIGWTLWGAIVTVPALAVMFVTLMAIGMGGVRRIRGELEDSVRQVHGLLFLQSHLDLPHPLPLLGGAAVSPDTAAVLVGLIQEHRPQLIVEFGSGTSTVICAQALKQTGAGRVISFDHDERYAALTRSALCRQGLDDWAEVRHAPIQPTTVDGVTWLWYATSQLPVEQKIDLLIVDGPPRKVQLLARYPAVPLLLDCLSPRCLIVADDTNRSDEQEIVRRWRQLLGNADEREVPFGKGATIFELREWTMPVPHGRPGASRAA